MLAYYYLRKKYITQQIFKILLSLAIYYNEINAPLA